MATAQTPAGAGGAPSNAERLGLIRSETRFELSLLHDRVNALVGAEAFLTIAYTGAMSNGAPWGARFAAVASPVLAGLGLLLALLAWPGVAATVRIVLDWTADQARLLESDPALSSAVSGLAGGSPLSRRVSQDQWRSMLFFRAVPGLFALVWTALLVLALVLRR